MDTAKPFPCSLDHVCCGPHLFCTLLLAWLHSTALHKCLGPSSCIREYCRKAQEAEENTKVGLGNCIGLIYHQMGPTHVKESLKQ